MLVFISGTNPTKGTRELMSPHVLTVQFVALASSLVPSHFPAGVYQMGEVYALSWVVIGTSFGILMLNRLASYAVQRGVGISITRA